MQDWSERVPPGRWFRGVSITDWVPGPVSPLFATTFVPQADLVFQDLFRELRGPRPPQPFLAVIRGRLYLSGDWSVSGLRTLVMPLASLAWMRRAVDRWREEWLPELRASARAWEVDPATLADEELVRGIDELARAGARYWRAAYIPRLAGLVEQLFTGFYGSFVRQHGRPHVSVLLRGTSTPGAEREARTPPHLDFVYATAAEIDLPAVAARAWEELRTEAKAAARDVASGLDPLRRRAFLALWRRARRWAALREESMLYMGFAWLPLRRLVREWEHRNGLPTDLGYFLTREELVHPPGHAAEVATARKSTWMRRRHEEAPLMLPEPFRIWASTCAGSCRAADRHPTMSSGVRGSRAAA